MTAPAESIGGSQQQTTARSKTNSKLPVRTTPVPSYQQYLGQELRARYLELQCEYELAEAEPSEPSRQAVTDVLNKRIKALLAEVSHMLCTQPDAYTIGSHLDLVEKLLVFVCPVPMLEAHAEILLSGLKTSAIENKAELEKGITQWLNPLSNTHDKQDHDDQHHDAQHHLRIALAEAVSACNRAHCQIIMNSNMQIQRLTGLRNWGIAITICFLLLSPLAINVEALLQLNTPTEYMLGTTVHMTGTPPQLIGDRWELAAIAWGQALAILLIGAISGFLSGLLQARHSQISIRGYRENRLKIQLKPLVGALVALLLYIFLSWNTIPGIKVDSTGSYLLLAFLAGFSERYFLQLGVTTFFQGFSPLSARLLFTASQCAVLGFLASAFGVLGWPLGAFCQRIYVRESSATNYAVTRSFLRSSSSQAGRHLILGRVFGPFSGCDRPNHAERVTTRPGKAHP